MVDNMEYSSESALDAQWGNSANWTVATLKTSGGADSTAKWMELSDGGWSMDIHSDYTGDVSVEMAGTYKMVFYYKNGHVDNPQGSLTVTIKDGSNNVKDTVSLGSSVVSSWTYEESDYFELDEDDTIKIDITGSYSGTSTQKCAFDQFELVPLSPTNVDTFEGYADESALDAVWGNSANWTGGTLKTSGGADSTSKWIEISDGGWSADIHATFSSVVPESRNYTLFFYYKNGHVDNPQGDLKITIKDGSDTQKAQVSLGSSVVSTWTWEESTSFSMSEGDTVKIDITGSYSGTLTQKCAFDQIKLLPQD